MRQLRAAAHHLLRAATRRESGAPHGPGTVSTRPIYARQGPAYPTSPWFGPRSPARPAARIRPRACGGTPDRGHRPPRNARGCAAAAQVCAGLREPWRRLGLPRGAAPPLPPLAAAAELTRVGGRISRRSDCAGPSRRSGTRAAGHPMQWMIVLSDLVMAWQVSLCSGGWCYLPSLGPKRPRTLR